MNKLYKILVVSLLMFSHTSWGMLIPHKPGYKPGDSSFKKSPAACPVLNRSFREHQEMVKELGTGELSVPRTGTAEEFLHVFGKQSLNDMPKKLCALGEKEGTRALCALSDNQKFVLEISKNPDIKLLVMTRLLNGNKEMAQECCKLPIAQVMRCCADAQKMKINYPITIETKPCGEQHYMVLTKEQIYALSNVTKNGTIHNSEINEFMDGLGKLIKIDPNITCDQKGLTDSIRLYPSLLQRIGCLYSSQSTSLNHVSIVSGAVYLFSNAVKGVLSGRINTIDNYKKEGIDVLYSIAPDGICYSHNQLLAYAAINNQKEYLLADGVPLENINGMICDDLLEAEKDLFERISSINPKIGMVSVVAGGLALGMTYVNYKDNIAQQIHAQPTLTQMLENNNS